ncbi:LysR family transcriptional regulator [Falsihalocynthiibacter sp. SS001]|uniref:LysR family transcriptional regulator n=1 Tax=Falsihalocynthiibacter sp. SS001 TaxID=3349698 RepID=UPI0036D2692C
MRNDWDDLRTVLYMVRHGSLTSAAQHLGVNYTTVSRRIAHAEERYGVRMFDRLSYGYVPTHAGREAASFAEQMEMSESEFRLKVAGRDAELSGDLKVTVPKLLVGALAGVLDQFLVAHPKVNLSILASDEVLNLNLREADLAVRVSNSPGDTLMGRRLTGQHIAAFSTAEVNARIEADPHKHIEWLGFSTGSSPNPTAPTQYPLGRVRLAFDDLSALVDAARAGLGVARLPLFLGRSAGLVMATRIPPEPFQDIWTVAHRDLWSNAKVVAFRELLVAYFREHRAEFEV